MRLVELKLAGFKSFVDPTSIRMPGQLVGVVGPNGCGKSNVIDAARWVLGEGRASALRGESMQDVIFNGAGDRPPAGRASVELVFDNADGRVGGPWGKYAEIAIRRVLARDGESSYYINNIPVRRRDIHDLFLGTGLGPRAYAIIEQGMISRVIEAKPEELRIFLEEAAGVSKYRERRKETEGRLADTRGNLSRVDDIRQELGGQLEKLDAQVRIANEYRALEARLALFRQLLWFTREQDCLRARERHAGEVATQATALEGLNAELRTIESQLEALRVEHFAAGDAVHERQGEFYEASTEVSRLEQQISFARDSDQRIARDLGAIAERIDALQGEASVLATERAAATQRIAELAEFHRIATNDEAAAQAAIPELDAAAADAQTTVARVQERIAAIAQDRRVAEGEREHRARHVDEIVARRVRLEAELARLETGGGAATREVAAQLDDERTELETREAALVALRDAVQLLQERQRGLRDTAQAANARLSDLEARAEALSALQAAIGHGRDNAPWLAEHGIAGARRIFETLDIEPGWENALEAVLRERLEALETARLHAMGGDAERRGPPRRLVVFAPDAKAAAAGGGADALLRKVRATAPGLARILADWLAGVRCRDDIGSALAACGALAPGECFVTPAGHVIRDGSIEFFAPDSELHGVLGRQREIAELASALGAARPEAAAARDALAAVESELETRQREYHEQSMAFASQQRRSHDLELELVQVTQAAEAAAARRAQVADEIVEVAAIEATERAAIAQVTARIADLAVTIHAESERREAAEGARIARESSRDAGRERARAAERRTQEAHFALQAGEARAAELDRRAEALRGETDLQGRTRARLSSERAATDLTPVEEELQARLRDRGAAEEALAAARDRVEAVAANLRAGEEARLELAQRIEPARTRIEEVRMKEQGAALEARQFAEQLEGAHADRAALPAALKEFGSKAQVPAEIGRLERAITDMGAVNLAAVGELAATTERKAYLDRQAADLTEAMATLESAIREIDRESRALLATTFETVNANFGRLFPALFGGGQARLVLTGSEILDAGVAVVAQPPGKRNASIHLLSGGEKALTATALVFALFELNPAPFCLLDEVDAPLDDPNTERFCRLVQTMSQRTQFVFISHNKITIEMASQLVGITMAEPGVSRVVAVDVREALDLAAMA